MKRDLTAFLNKATEDGTLFIGEITVTRLPNNLYELRHRDDSGRQDLKRFTNTTDALPLSLWTDTGEYRPLKSAPTLQHGWILLVETTLDLRRALDFFYPAMLGIWASYCSLTLRPVPLHETLGRQSGMFAITKNLRPDEALSLVREVCGKANCLKQILWRVEVDPHSSGPSPEKTDRLPNDLQNVAGEIPLLCQEACGVFISAARASVKARQARESETQPPPSGV